MDIQELCIVPRWLDSIFDLIGVKVLDCRRAGAEQKNDRPYSSVGAGLAFAEPLDFIAIHLPDPLRTGLFCLT